MSAERRHYINLYFFIKRAVRQTAPFLSASLHLIDKVQTARELCN